MMSLAQFEEELRHIARFDKSVPLVNPLSAAVQKITDSPALSQARLLSQLLRALTEQCGQFRRAEASAFDMATLRLAIALIDTAHAGTNTRADWLNAIAAAESVISQ